MRAHGVDIDRIEGAIGGWTTLTGTVTAAFAWIEPEVAEWQRRCRTDCPTWTSGSHRPIRRIECGEDADRGRAERQGLGAQVGEAGAE